MKIKQRQRENKEERCAVCRDGPIGLVVCRGCKTLLHASCLIDVRGCPTIGCNEKDPLQERAVETEVVSDSPTCVIHTPERFDAACLRDLRDLWGSDLKKSCVCEGPKFPSGIRPGPYGVVKEHQAIRRAEAGPQKEPACNHRFNPADYRCFFCHVTEEEVFEYHNAIGPLAYLSETVICASSCCREPTTRKAQFCSLCQLKPGNIYAMREFTSPDGKGGVTTSRVFIENQRRKESQTARDEIYAWLLFGGVVVAILMPLLLALLDSPAT